MNIFIFENNWQAVAAELDDESLDMFLANCGGTLRICRCSTMVSSRVVSPAR